MIDEKTLEKIRPGAVVKVTETFKEKDKKKTSAFRGIIIARKHGKEVGATFTVRAVIAGEGVEKIYPIYSPRVSKVEILSSPKKIKKAKLYFIRNLSEKQIRQKLGLGK